MAESQKCLLSLAPCTAWAGESARLAGSGASAGDRIRQGFPKRSGPSGQDAQGEPLEPLRIRGVAGKHHLRVFRGEALRVETQRELDLLLGLGDTPVERVHHRQAAMGFAKVAIQR